LELRHPVAGTVSGRNNHNQIVFAKMMATGVAYVADAKLAYDKATEMEW
jgi:ornithine cyclodeaminase/alanine dehydrogenase-like protein (mu-crystallin family)